MAGLRGNQASLAIAKQSGRGVPNSTFPDLLPFSGGNIQPSRAIDNLSETDANRDQGVSYVQQTAVEGSPEVYVRDANIHHILEGALGSLSTGGSTNYTHTITPANALPYYTLLKSLGGTLFERFEDCQISELTIAADTGSPLTASFDVLGRSAHRLGSAPPTNEVQTVTVSASAGQFKLSYAGQTTADIAYNAVAADVQTALEALSNLAPGDVVVTGGPGDAGGTTPYVLTFGGALAATDVLQVTGADGTTPLSGGTGITTATTAEGGAALPSLANGAVYNFNEAAVTLGGVATALVSSFELTIANNVTLQQTDDSVPYDVVPGLREVTLGFQLIFENLTEYNKFHYGGATGTTQSPNIFTTSAAFLFSKGANNSIGFTLPSIAYEEFPVEPDPGGDPVVVDVRARAQRGGSPVVTAVVKNQAAT